MSTIKELTAIVLSQFEEDENTMIGEQTLRQYVEAELMGLFDRIEDEL